MSARTFGWSSIFRLGLVQTALGAIVVLTTSTLNRVMVVELALPAMLPGALVTLHHVLQMLRPRMGYGSDVGRRHSPWIVGGMATLAVGGVGAAAGTALMATHFVAALLVSIVSFSLIGCGVSAAGTSLLVLMAKRVSDERRARAATIVWMMMIAGFAITATVAGRLLEPYSPMRLIEVAAGVSTVAFLLAVAALAGVEGHDVTSREGKPRDCASFATAFGEVWAEPNARRFTVFVFVSMLAYSAQDLILEPFAGSIFALSPGQSTKLAGAQHGGVFAGMLLVAVVTGACKGTPGASLKGWVVGGCLASACAMVGLVFAGLMPGSWPLTQNVFLLGVANGAFSIAAIGGMMTLASQGRGSREGMRMGLWGAAQAIAFGVGGFTGTVLVDLAKRALGSSGAAYSAVFALEALGFFAAHVLALKTVFHGEEQAVVNLEALERELA